MVVLFLLIIALTLLFSIYMEKNIYNPVSLLSVFWGVIGFFASLGLYGMMRISDKTWIVTIISFCAFSSGALFSKQLLGAKYLVIGRKSDKGKTSFQFRYNIFRIMVICMLVYVCARMVTVIAMLRAGYNLDMIRLVYFGADVNGYKTTSLFSVIEMYVHLPCLYGGMGIIAYNFVLEKSKKILDSLTMILGMIWLLLAQIMTGGRTIIYIFVVEVFVMFIIANKGNYENIIKIIRRYSKIIILLLLAVVAIYILSLARKNSETYDVFKSVYVYFCGCLAHMSLRFEDIEFQPYTNGISLLSGILRPIALIIKYVFGAYPEIYQRTLDIGGQLQSLSMIGPNIEFNAYVLSPFFFYYDGAYLGVLVDSFICGIVCYRFYKNTFRINSNCFYYTMYLLIIYAIFTSMIRYAGNLVYYILAFVVVRLLFKKRRDVVD